MIILGKKKIDIDNLKYLIVDEFQDRNEGALYQLDQMIEYYSRVGNNAEVKKYTIAKAALNEMAAERLG